MSDTEHIIRIVLHMIQAVVALAFLLCMWKWSRSPKLTALNKTQEDAVLAEIERQHELRKRQEEILGKPFPSGR